jgi:hypothetical protein
MNELRRPAAIVRAAEDLSELAAGINREHAAAEGAARAGLDHARRAGELLFQAKAQCGHGRWLAWLAEHCRCSARTAQLYTRLASRWAEVEAKCATVAHLQLREALALLSEPELPPALESLRSADVLPDDALPPLLALATDYGPDVVSCIRLASADAPASADGTWAFLYAIRPLDHPTLWPLPRLRLEEKGGAAVAAATKVFWEDARARRGTMPQWEVAAFWFGATMVALADVAAPFRERFTPILIHHLAVWRESLQTALAWMCICGFDAPAVKKRPRDSAAYDHWRMWWGYYADLRHAGALEAARKMEQDPEAYPVLRTSMLAGREAMEGENGYPSPSTMQGRLELLLEADDEGCPSAESDEAG